MSANLYDNYLEGQVFSASALHLVVLLYRAAIDSLQTARGHLASGDVRGRVAASAKATNILVGLTQSLNMEKGGDLATRLAELYAYLLRRIHQANTQLDDKAYAEAIGLMQTILDGWVELDAPAQSSPYDIAPSLHEPLEVTF